MGLNVAIALAGLAGVLLIIGAALVFAPAGFIVAGLVLGVVAWFAAGVYA